MNPSSSRTIARAALLPLLATGLALAAAPAEASGGDAVRRSGACSGSSHWKLKAKPDDGRLEVEAEVDSNVVGQTWRWRLLHDGSVSARGTATTRGASGSWSVERRLVDSAGTDHLVLKARNVAGGERCTGRLSL